MKHFPFLSLHQGFAAGSPASACTNPYCWKQLNVEAITLKMFHTTLSYTHFYRWARFHEWDFLDTRVQTNKMKMCHLSAGSSCQTTIWAGENKQFNIFWLCTIAHKNYIVVCFMAASCSALSQNWNKFKPRCLFDTKTWKIRLKHTQLALQGSSKSATVFRSDKEADFRPRFPTATTQYNKLSGRMDSLLASSLTCDSRSDKYF